MTKTKVIILEMKVYRYIFWYSAKKKKWKIQLIDIPLNKSKHIDETFNGMFV